MDSKILRLFVWVRMNFLSVPHGVKLRSVSDDICFVRSYRMASFGHVKIFELTPPDKDIWWMNVTCVLVKQFVLALWASCSYPTYYLLMSVQREL